MRETIEWLNRVAAAFVQFNLSMLIQSSILILIVLLLDGFLHKRVRAVFRYWMWMLVTVKLLLPVHLALPTSPVYWSQAQEATVNTHALAGPNETSPQIALVAPSGGPIATLPSGPSLTPVSSEFVQPLRGRDIQGEASLARVVNATNRAQPVALTWQAILFLTWSVGVSAALAYLFFNIIALRRRMASCQAAPPAMMAQLQDCLVSLGLRRCVDLRLTSNFDSPCVAGLTRPVILFPAALLDKLTPRQFQSILMHEIVHIRRHDLWVSLCQSLLQIVYFFNPLLWWANARIRQVREQAVDETVLVALDQHAGDYPQTLIDISKLAFDDPLPGLRLIGVVESRRALFNRIRHIAQRPMPTSMRLGTASIIALVGLALTLLPMAKGKPGLQRAVDAAEASDATNSMSLTYEGIVTDRLGRPRQCVVITPQGKRIWQGVRSDSQGRFLLEDVGPEQTIWTAWSQAGGRLGVFQLPDPPSDKPVHAVLSYEKMEVVGRVLRADGKGLAKQQVKLIVTTPDGIRFPVMEKPKTNAFGVYSFGGIPAGEGLTVEVVVENPALEGRVYRTGPISTRERQIVLQMPTLLAATEKRQPDFDRNMNESGMLQYGGRVVDRYGKPIEGVEVQLRYDMPKQMSTWVRAAVTDDQGRWHSLLPPQCIDFRVRSLDHPDYHVVGSLGVPTREELEKSTHTATMQFGCVLSGRVVNEENQPVENALVCAEQPRSGTAGPCNQMIETCRTQRTDADGTFRIGGLPPGPREIAVFSSEYAPTIQAIDVQIGSAGITVLVKSGRHFLGHIVDAQGDPIEGVVIGIDRWSQGTKQRDMNRVARSDSDGAFCLSNLPEGRISLAIAKKGYEYIRKDVPEDLVAVDELVMTQTLTIRGTVVDDDTNEPVPSFWYVDGSVRADQSQEFSRYHRTRVEDAKGQFTHRWRGFAPYACLKFQARGYLPSILFASQLDPIDKA